ncbi:MAG: hypothetical protein R8M14_06575 [Ghiorsea sp.]
MPRKLTQEQVIEQFKSAHADKYDYSLTEYVNNHSKVKIICKKHGVFEQRPADHKAGIGCIGCGFDATKSKQSFTQNDVIKQFYEAHGDRYDYSKVKYQNSSTPIKIICSIHGAFYQSPDGHKNGANCPQCAFANKSRGSHYTQWYAPTKLDT